MTAPSPAEKGGVSEETIQRKACIILHHVHGLSIVITGVPTVWEY